MGLPQIMTSNYLSQIMASNQLQSLITRFKQTNSDFLITGPVDPPPRPHHDTDLGDVADLEAEGLSVPGPGVHVVPQQKDQLKDPGQLAARHDLFTGGSCGDDTLRAIRGGGVQVCGRSGGSQV